jgi:hypothetical protein
MAVDCWLSPSSEDGEDSDAPVLVESIDVLVILSQCRFDFSGGTVPEPNPDDLGRISE